MLPIGILAVNAEAIGMGTRAIIRTLLKLARKNSRPARLSRMVGFIPESPLEM